MNLMNPNIEKTCRMCADKPETTSHLMSGCKTMLASGSYTARHNSICRLIHYQILKHYNMPKPEKHYDYEPKKITTHGTIVIYYDYPIPIARHIEGGCIKSDILVHDIANRTAKIIEVGVTNDTTLSLTEWKKTQKYQDLKNAIKNEWNLEKCEVIPVIVGNTGVIKKSLSSYLERIPGKLTTGGVQYEAIRGTVSILKRVLSGGQDVIG